MKSSPTGLLGLGGNERLTLPPLAYHRPRTLYTPTYGDIIIWTKWFTTWYGVVTNNVDDQINVIFEGLPILLFTMNEAEQGKNTFNLKLSEVRNAKNGKYSILQRDPTTRENIWYV